jgi:oxalate decarboxylase/phosphoglucose isomerase-like protein (cupin superfamily)
VTNRHSASDCRVIEFPRVDDPRGKLTFVEQGRHVPFDIHRVFYIFDVPTGESRGAHAHRALQQVVVCLSGSFDVSIDDGRTKSRVHLNRPWQGLYIPPMIWAAEVNFDPGSICLVLASALYDASDYIRDYDEFLRLAR